MGIATALELSHYLVGIVLSPQRCVVPVGWANRQDQRPRSPPTGVFCLEPRLSLSPWELGLVLLTAHSLECRGTETYGHKELSMALDDDAARVLEVVRLSGRPPLEGVTPAEARSLFLRGRDVFSPDPAPVAEIHDMVAVGPDGAARRQ